MILIRDLEFKIISSTRVFLYIILSSLLKIFILEIKYIPIHYSWLLTLFSIFNYLSFVELFRRLYCVERSSALLEIIKQYQITLSWLISDGKTQTLDTQQDSCFTEKALSENLNNIKINSKISSRNNAIYLFWECKA